MGSVTTAGIYETEWAALGSEDQSAHKSTRSQHKQVPQIFSRVLVLQRGRPEGGLWNMGGGRRLVPATAGWSLVSSETPQGGHPGSPAGWWHSSVRERGSGGNTLRGDFCSDRQQLCSQTWSDRRWTFSFRRHCRAGTWPAKAPLRSARGQTAHAKAPRPEGPTCQHPRSLLKHQ